MGNIGTAMSQTIPAVGSSGTQYATDIDAFLTEVKVRLTALVPRSSLAPGALDMANNAVQNVSYVGLQSGAGTPSTPAGSLQTFGGNLYWVTGSGAAQLTSGNALNTASVGAITGDYGGVNPAQFRFVAADLEYYAYTNYAGGTWAKLWTNGLDVASGTTSSNRARITYGGAGSYGLTLPPALPASTLPLSLSSAGAITTNGVITDYKHGILSRGFAPIGSTSSSSVTVSNTSNGFIYIYGATSTSYVPFHGFVAGDRINSITWIHSDSGTASTFSVYIGGILQTTSISNTSTQFTITLTTPYTMTKTVGNTSLGDTTVLLKIVAGSGTAQFANGFTVQYDRP